MTDKDKKLIALTILKLNSEKDVFKNFLTILEYIKILQKTNKEELGLVDTKYADMVSQLQVGTKSDIKSLKDMVLSYLDEELKKVKEENNGALSVLFEDLKQKITFDAKDFQETIETFCDSEMGKMMGKVEAKLATVRNGDPGKDADVAGLALEASKLAVEAVKPLIPTIPQISEEIPKLGEPIRDALELLQGDERLDKSAIKGLEDEIAELRALISSKGSSMGGATNVHDAMKGYDLSPYLDGVTSVFSVPAMWDIKTIISSDAPFNFRKTIDYVYDASAHTVTFTSQIDPATALATGHTVTILHS
jgi:hypothetical protein